MCLMGYHPCFNGASIGYISLKGSYLKGHAVINNSTPVLFVGRMGERIGRGGQ